MPCKKRRSPLDKQLIEAARKDDAKEVERLLAAGADKEAGELEEGTPLMNAALHGSTKAMRVLLDAGANKNGKDREKFTVLHRAVISGGLTAVKMLIAERADLEAKNSFGETPLISQLRKPILMILS